MTMVKAFKTRLRFPRLSEISEDLEAVTDIDDQQEGRIWFGSRKGTDVTFGLAARFDHGVVPGVGAPNRLIRFAHFETGTAGGEIEFGSFGLGRLELLGFEDEAAAFIQVDP